MSAGRPATSSGYIDQEWLGSLVSALSAIERETATPGEREAAEWVVARLSEQGADARIETEHLHNTYWWPLGLAGATGALAGIAALRGHRLTGAALGAAASYAAATDMPPGRRLLREALLPKRETSNVVAEIGPGGAERTVVLVAHHDAAHSGLVFHPAIPELADRAGLIENANTSPPLMWPIIGGPAAVAAGSLLGSRLLVRAGALVSALFAAEMVDIGLRRGPGGQ